jgi:hypothetical protein
MAPSPDVVAWVEGVNSRPPSDDGVVVEMAVVGLHVTVCEANAAVEEAVAAADDDAAEAVRVGVGDAEAVRVGVGAAEGMGD